MPFALPPFDVVAIVSNHVTPAQRGAQPGTTSSNPPSPSSSSPPPVDATASSTPPDGTTASAAPRARRHRRRTRAHRVTHRRTRRIRRTERRGPAVVITTRYIGFPGIATEGSPGPTWTARFTGHPLAGDTHMARYVRFGLGAEVGFRAAPHDRLDPFAWALVDVGFQYPFRAVTLFATGLLATGLGERFRFDHGTFEFAWQLGAEIGIDLRPPRSPVGLELALGFGRTGWGDQWTVNGWFRFGLAFF